MKAFRVLVEAALPDLTEAVTVHPACQEEPYNPGRDVSINPKSKYPPAKPGALIL